MIKNTSERSSSDEIQKYKWLQLKKKCVCMSACVCMSVSVCVCENQQNRPWATLCILQTLTIKATIVLVVVVRT